MTFSYNPGGGPDEFPNSREAPPSEEQGHGEAMVRLGAKMNRAGPDSPLWMASPLSLGETRELFGIIADLSQRLRSERPAVTPEERKCVVCEQPVTEDESFKFLAFDGYYHQGCDFIVEIPEQSTEGKP